jgi:hypothetical protein
MSEVKGQSPPRVPVALVLIDAVHNVLQNSTEPLPASRIRALLPRPFRNVSLEELADHLDRQVAAKVLWQFPKYRSVQDRFWDRPMKVHVGVLLKEALTEGPLAWSELRRKLPGYAKSQAADVLQDQVSQKQLFRYPRCGRIRERFGVQPPDLKLYLRPELISLFHRLSSLGFHPDHLRACALELLHDDEWGCPPPAPT